MIFFRGAELIEELSHKQIQEQLEGERKILEKIKYKMDRIKASQQKVQGPSYKEPGSHFTGQPSQWFICVFYHWSGHFTCFNKKKVFSLFTSL